MSECKTGWFPGRISKPYRDHFDDIKWEATEKGIAQKGKAKQSTTSRNLEIDETVKAVRTPISERTDKTFRYLD